MRTGLSTPGATHLIKVAVEAALGRRARIDVYGTDYPTPDGTCIRDFIHVSDLARAHLAALNYLRDGGASATLNCGYGRGYSVREVLDAVRRAVGHRFPGELRRAAAPATSWCRSPPQTASASCCDWTPELDDLDAIVGHALAWERHLMSQSDPARSEPGSARPFRPDIAGRPQPLISLEKAAATGKERRGAPQPAAVGRDAAITSPIWADRIADAWIEIQFTAGRPRPARRR